MKNLLITLPILDYKMAELALKETAIDCELFKHANVYPEEGEDIECEI